MGIVDGDGFALDGHVGLAVEDSSVSVLVRKNVQYLLPPFHLSPLFTSLYFCPCPDSDKIH